MIRPFAIFAKGLFYGPGKRSYSSGASTRIAKAILGVQSAGFALFYGPGKCSYSSSTHGSSMLLRFL